MAVTYTHVDNVHVGNREHSKVIYLALTKESGKGQLICLDLNDSNLAYLQREIAKATAPKGE